MPDLSGDVKRLENGAYEVYTASGKQPTGMDPAAWARQVEAYGAGEIFLNSIDRDGSAQGYDVELIRRVVEATTIPVIACGGVGRYSDFAAGGAFAGLPAAWLFRLKVTDVLRRLE